MRARALHSARVGVSALCLAMVAGMLAVKAPAQVCAACALPKAFLANPTDSWTFRKQVNEVEVFFTASHHGKFVDGLTRDDVSVRDDGRPAEILEFRDQNNLPLRIALLVDTSDSVRDRLRFEKDAAAAFLHQVLARDADQALTAGFQSHLHVTQDFTHDARLLERGLGMLVSGGGTAAYDAIYTACRKLATPPAHGLEARVLIILSDGEDNASRVNRAEAIAFAQQSEVTVYAISTNFAASGLDGDRNLQELATQTGGQALFPGTVRNVRHAFSRIGNELRHRYAVAYRPPEFDPDGRFRSIRIWAKKSGKKLKVKARKGYYAR